MQLNREFHNIYNTMESAMILTCMVYKFAFFYAIHSSLPNYVSLTTGEVSSGGLVHNGNFQHRDYKSTILFLPFFNLNNFYKYILKVERTQLKLIFLLIQNHSITCFDEIK